VRKLACAFEIGSLATALQKILLHKSKENPGKIYE
jgi:hypothetical protein